MSTPRRREFLALGEQNVDLIGSDAHIVNLVEAHAARCRTDKADCVARHEDIGVGRLAATIEHYIVNTVSENQQRAFGWEHPHTAACHSGDVVAPDTTGVDGQRCEIFAFFP